MAYHPKDELKGGIFVKGKGARYFGKLIRHDLYIGLLCGWHRYLAVFFLAVILFSMPYMNYQSVLQNGGQLGEITLGNYLLSAFAGMQPYNPSSDNPFEIPIYWFALQLYLAFVVGGYANRDLAGYGKNILIRARTRAGWWLSKCIWNVASVLVYYTILFLCAVLFAAATGSVSLLPNLQIAGEWLNVDCSAVSAQRAALVLVLAPLFSSLAVCLLQMLLSFILRPVYSYMVIAILMISSAYCYTTVLPGNWSMLLRSDVFLVGGIPLESALILALLLAVASVLIGLFFFKQCDILEKNT